ncbi:YggS family pyridoxal phosphate-dependent enzyme [Robertkochia marina]|uniref:Pyridoxal phosphate homeostasis protein n=2 Tax=Robertkochia marina TaxID=1227945 RepID=A0A4S3M395_9FLAO|nr:YggS family pyridoxal phosphate-dependent enzyme [Robertkochia marina]THD68119.1 YggS family pyridoxal phosphate-dependent enzyme [Robertkochia marina]TRZ41754.1 YggS family pyridoxal phosphate-dependent enzyme [Robertkochia marina]
MIAEKLNTIKSNLPQNVTLIAVSKTKPEEDIMEAYRAGHRDFGENKVQEMTAKYENLPKDIRWHMIGHVQRNKVKYMAPFVHMIHGVDSLKLLKEIEKQAKKQDRVINCLLQIHIAREESKFGLDEEELKELLASEAFSQMKYVHIKGLMGMATFTDKQEVVQSEFSYLKQLFESLKKDQESWPHLSMEVLSMGMSGDYELAVECGSTMVRIGSSIFGERNYQ